MVLKNKNKCQKLSKTCFSESNETDKRRAWIDVEKLLVTRSKGPLSASTITAKAKFVCSIAEKKAGELYLQPASSLPQYLTLFLSDLGRT